MAPPTSWLPRSERRANTRDRRSASRRCPRMRRSKSKACSRSPDPARPKSDAAQCDALSGLAHCAADRTSRPARSRAWSDRKHCGRGQRRDRRPGRVTILIELKSRLDGDVRLGQRVADVLAVYGGPAAPMSFDPWQVRALRHKAPNLPCGIIAAKYRPHPYWDLMPAWMRLGMGYLLTGLVAQPQFIAYAAADLPALAPSFVRRFIGLPLLAS